MKPIPFLLILLTLFLTACSHQPQPSAGDPHFWAIAGFSAETTKSISAHRSTGGPAVSVGFEKQLGGGVGIGMEGGASN